MYDNDDNESFGRNIMTQIISNTNKDLYSVVTTELSKTQFKKLNLMKEDKYAISSEKAKVSTCDYFILIFPYLTTGLPSIVKLWFDLIFDKSYNIETAERKSLLITYTNFPQETFQPNSFHRSTLKRRLHFLLYGVLKHNNFQPVEPLVFYSYKSNDQAIIEKSKKSSNNLSITGSDKEKEMSIGGKKVIDDISQSSKGRASLNRSKLSNKKGYLFTKDDFYSQITLSLEKIDEANEIDVLEL